MCSPRWRHGLSITLPETAAPATSDVHELFTRLMLGDYKLGAEMVLQGGNRMNLILVVVVLLILFGGGGFYYGGPYVGGGLGTILLIVLIVLLLRG